MNARGYPTWYLVRCQNSWVESCIGHKPPKMPQTLSKLPHLGKTWRPQIACVTIWSRPPSMTQFLVQLALCDHWVEVSLNDTDLMMKPAIVGSHCLALEPTTFVTNNFGQQRCAFEWLWMTNNFSHPLCAFECLWMLQPTYRCDRPCQMTKHSQKEQASEHPTTTKVPRERHGWGKKEHNASTTLSHLELCATILTNMSSFMLSAINSTSS